MRRSERVSRVYISAVMFAEAFVIISFRHTLPAWVWIALLFGAGAMLLPLASERPTRFVRIGSSVVAIVLAVSWAWTSWPIGTIGWLAWAALIWFATLPGRDGHTPQEHERRDPSV